MYYRYWVAGVVDFKYTQQGGTVDRLVEELKRISKVLEALDVRLTNTGDPVGQAMALGTLAMLDALMVDVREGDFHED